MAHERITLHMTGREIMLAIGESNPGAISIVAQLLNEAHRIDPDNLFGGFGPLMTLDTLGVYGYRVHVLCKDICGNDLRNMIAVLRGFQLGYLSKEEIHKSIDKESRTFDLDKVIRQVEDRLPSFMRPRKRIKRLYKLYLYFGGGQGYWVDDIGLPSLTSVYCAKVANRAAASLRHLGFDVRAELWEGSL